MIIQDHLSEFLWSNKAEFKQWNQSNPYKMCMINGASFQAFWLKKNNSVESTFLKYS